MNNSALNKFAASYADAWCSHDPEAVAAFYTKNATISINGGAATPILEVARSFMRDFPEMIVTFDKLEAREDRIAFHWTLIGTYAQNGNRVRISGYELWKIADEGLIAESQGHFDAADYQHQLTKK